MRAVVVHASGDEDVLAVEEVPVPEPGDGQVRLRVAGAAVNRTDLNLRAGLYPGPVPDGVGATFGMDVSGTVDAIGAGVSDLSVGDAVVAFAGPPAAPAAPAAQAEHVVLDAGRLADETVAVIEDGGVYVTFRPDEDRPEPPRGIRQFDSWVSNDGAQPRHLVEQVDAGDLRLPPAAELRLEQVADAQHAVAAGGVRERPVLVPRSRRQHTGPRPARATAVG